MSLFLFRVYLISEHFKSNSKAASAALEALGNNRTRAHTHHALAFLEFIIT